jgi:phospholipid transport system substrate-binding protein
MKTPTGNSTIWRLGASLLLAAFSSAVAAGTNYSAEAVVKVTSERVFEALSENREAIRKDPSRIYSIVNQWIVPHFDFERMSQRVLGKFWHRATKEQRTKFSAQFQTLLAHTYAAALREYTNEKVEYLPSRQRQGGAVSVRTQIIQSGGPPIPIQYEMYQRADGWKVYDVSIDGVSLVINYRTTFASEIRSNGLDGLIERLAEHNQNRRSAS